MRRTTPTRDNEIEREKFFHERERGGRTLFSVELACSSSSGIRWMEGRTSQSAWPAQSFRQTREGEADIPKQTEHSAERACRRNLFLPFGERKESPFPGFSFRDTVCPIPSPFLLTRHSTHWRRAQLSSSVFSGSVKIRWRTRTLIKHHRF